MVQKQEGPRTTKLVLIGCVCAIGCQAPLVQAGDSVRRMTEFETQAPMPATYLNSLPVGEGDSSPRSWISGLEVVVSDQVAEIEISARHAVLAPADTDDAELWASIVPEWTTCLEESPVDVCGITFAAPLTGYLSTELRLTVPTTLASPLFFIGGRDVEEMDAIPGDDPITASQLISLTGWRGSVHIDAPQPIYLDLTDSPTTPCVGSDCEGEDVGLSLQSLGTIELLLPLGWSGRLQLELFDPECLILPEGSELSAEGAVEFNTNGAEVEIYFGTIVGQCIVISFG